MQDYDFIIIGAGIVGASAAYYLSRHGRTIILERETLPGYHATGRSAAIFRANTNCAVTNKLVLASQSFLTRPPENFSQSPILTDRGIIFTGTKNDTPLIQNNEKQKNSLCSVSPEDTKQLVPFIKDTYLHHAVYEKKAQEIDVAALHQGFLNGAKNNGCNIIVNAGLNTINHTNDIWVVKTTGHEYRAPVIVNAAGAWADHIANMANVSKLGLVPKRRTVIVAGLPEIYQDRLYPMVIFNDSRLYFKTEHGQVLISPMDETPSEPVDAAPEEYDVALAAHLFEERTGIAVQSIKNKWAGLRSFVADNKPVVGHGDKSGFIWCAGQGGSGIKTAEATARIVESLALHKDMPQDLAALGITFQGLSPNRLKIA